LNKKKLYPGQEFVRDFCLAANQFKAIFATLENAVHIVCVEVQEFVTKDAKRI